MNNVEVDFDSSHFRSVDYLRLIERIRENFNKLPDLQVCDKLVYKRTNHASGDDLQEQQVWTLWFLEELTTEVITRAHDRPWVDCGCGFIGHKMVSQVKDYIRNCET